MSNKLGKLYRFKTTEEENKIIVMSCTKIKSTRTFSGVIIWTPINCTRWLVGEYRTDFIWESFKRANNNVIIHTDSNAHIIHHNNIKVILKDDYLKDAIIIK